MSYVKNVWQTGDTITASKLNNMENGIEAAQGGGGGGSDLPDYSSAHKGDALVVNGTSANKYLVWDSVLPAYSTYGSDNGKVLTVYGSQVYWETPSSGEGVPSYGWSDIGKMLAVSCTSGGAMLRWQAIREVPEFSSSNKGQFLTVKESHTDSGRYYMDWEDCLPDYSSLSGDEVLKYDSSQGLMWGSVPDQWQHYGVPAYSYQDYPVGSVLAIAAGPSTTCDLEWITFEGLPTLGCAGNMLVVGESNGSPIALWQPVIPASGTGYEPGALLVVENTTGILPSFKYAGGGQTGNVMVMGDYGPEWAELLPAYDTSLDVGKVLTITASGPRWTGHPTV